MKVLRILFLLLGIWVVLNATFSILCYFVPWVIGVTETTHADWVKLIVWILTFVCGFGALRLKNWARWGLIGLVIVKFALIGITFFAVRNVGWDGLGIVLVTMVCIIFVVILTGLILVSPVTNAAEKPDLKGWMVAGITAVFLGIAGYGLCLIEIDPMKLGDLGRRPSGGLEYLKASKEWKLAKLTVINLYGGKAQTRKTADGLMILTNDGDATVVKGLPALKGLDLKIDLERNVLLLNDTLFIGEEFKTERLIWQDIPAKGVEFVCEETGRLSGKIIVARALNDDSVYLLINLDVYGKAVEAFYMAKPNPESIF